MADVIQELEHLNKLAKGLTKKARCFVELVIWLIITARRASKQTRIMLESRMQGQLACPVWCATKYITVIHEQQERRE
jgi:hypothetical protein